MFNSKKNLGKTRRNARYNTSRSNLQVESLEQRTLMAVVAISSDVYGKLSVTCNDAADNITVYKSGANVLVKSTSPTGAETTWNMGSTLRNIEIRTNGGNDVVTNNTSLPATIYGGADADVLNGGSGIDWLYGEAGRDILKGNGGNDVLWGGTENDSLYGNAGADYLYGENGDDTLFGGGGDDYLSGGNDNDWMAGDDAGGAAIVDGVMAGNDQLYGGAGNDTLRGDYGMDRLYGDQGNDYLDGGDAADRLFGNGDYDTLYGGGGDDFLDAGSKNSGEYINGGAGNDFNAFQTVVNGASNMDIQQGGSNNCFMLAAMGAAASRGVDMGQRIRYAGNGVYYVSLFRESGGTYTPTTVSVIFDGTLKSTDPTAHFRGQEGESWPIIMNRALGQLLNLDLNTITGGYSGLPLGAILGHAPVTTTWAEKAFPGTIMNDPLLNYLYNAQGASVTLGTRNTAADVGDARIAPDHVYMLHSVQITGYAWFGGAMVPQYQVILINPWGIDMDKGGPTYGANDGVIVLTGAEFRSAFDEITLA